MKITVENILDLLVTSSYIQIFVHGITYEIPVDEIPNEILYMRVQSIDDPYFASENHPLCLNIDPDEIENPNEFQIMYDEYALN